ncbi:MAG: radical SAM protein [Clostridia bacterium]
MAKIYPVFIPHLACKNDCIFCNQRKISGTLDVITPKSLYEKLKAENLKDTEIAFYGGSFTGIEKDLMIEYLSVAREFTNSIRLSTRPDYISTSILDILKEYGVKTIELGVQSLDDEVLKTAKRGHTRADVFNAVSLVKQYNFTLILQMMIGLPNDTTKKALKTANEIVSLKPYGVRIYPVITLNETQLKEMLLAKEYTPLSLNEAVSLSAEISILFINNNIEIIRTGLHNEDGLQNDIVAGPFHPAFGELVFNKIYLNIIEKNMPIFSTSLTIYCNPQDISKVIGHKKCNAIYLKEKYNINIKVKGKTNIKKYNLEIVGD